MFSRNAPAMCSRNAHDRADNRSAMKARVSPLLLCCEVMWYGVLYTISPQLDWIARSYLTSTSSRICLDQRRSYQQYRYSRIRNVKELESKLVTVTLMGPKQHSHYGGRPSLQQKQKQNNVVNRRSSSHDSSISDCRRRCQDLKITVTVVNTAGSTASKLSVHSMCSSHKRQSRSSQQGSCLHGRAWQGPCISISCLPPCKLSRLIWDRIIRRTLLYWPVRRQSAAPPPLLQADTSPIVNAVVCGWSAPADHPPGRPRPSIP